MLEEYKKKYTKAVIQHSVLDYNGLILESDESLFLNFTNNNISSIHPFFECIIPSLKLQNENILLSCVHLDINGTKIISDIILQTFSKGKKPLLTIHDLTSHYNNYQIAAQVKNESVINSQILELKNIYLKEKESFKNTFIANFSHELRDPLTGIITFTDILSTTKLSNTQKDYLKIVSSSSNFLKKMIDDILDVSRIESGKLELNIEPFSLTQLLNETRFDYKIKAEKKGLKFFSDFDEKLPEVLGGDSKRLRQVITNLLDNAIKFTSDGSVTFNVSLNQIRAQRASVHFEIIDTGIGIKKENLNKIFTNFSQINETENHKGSGLGLSIVKYLVELTNSKINITSEYGKGSTFSTNINFIANQSLKNKKDKNLINPSLNPLKKYNILLVEDSEITQLSVLKILAEHGQFFLDIVTKPNEAIARITKYDNEIDLVLLDIKLKEYRGEDIAIQIRKLPERHQKKVPIIAMTSNVFKEDLKKYKKAGINSVLKKPFNQAQLLDKISELLN